jgi:hypothetical protein
MHALVARDDPVGWCNALEKLTMQLDNGHKSIKATTRYPARRGCLERT